MRKNPNFFGECPVVGQCDRCAGEIYADDTIHIIDGFLICGECFSDFAEEYFASEVRYGREIKEM